ncbi:MAG: TadE/TadG family type IV pilus assembly protein [Mycobacterium sp.]
MALTSGVLGGRRGQTGVTLVEFAIVLPIFITVFCAMIEFGFAFNAVLSINRASQNGALIAGQAGSDANADCLILSTIEDQLQAPIDRQDVTEVRISRTGSTGSGNLASNVYVRSGTKDCGDHTVPYSATTSGYPASQRCDVLAGCPTLSPARSTVDKIAVQITYRFTAVTPMRNLLSFLSAESSSGFNWVFSKRNVSRLEPVQ